MKFRKYDQAQRKFIDLDYRKVLGEDSDPVMIDNIVNTLDLSRIEEKYVEVGNPAYHPKMMVKVLIYGYYKSYFGGRPLHRNYETDLGLRFLSNDDFPDHRTINLFRINFKQGVARCKMRSCGYRPIKRNPDVLACLYPVDSYANRTSIPLSD